MPRCYRSWRSPVNLPLYHREQSEASGTTRLSLARTLNYWAVDWNYDGATFKSQWQAIRGNRKRAKVVPVSVTEKLEAGRKYKVAVRVVDVFGNEAAGAVVIDL